MKSSVLEPPANFLTGLKPTKPISELQDSVVYGPIHSRRLGCSLGINPLPVSYKFCDFDCVYCQYGWTPEKGNGEKLKRAPELLNEIEKSFQYHRRVGTPVKCITLAGNGEPTIHPDFAALVDGIINLRDSIFPDVKVGILTDSSQAHRPEIRATLEKLDDRYMKLDAGLRETIERINKPRGNFDFDRMVKALSQMSDIVVQSLFMWGSFDNTTEAELDAWIEKIKMIRPREVQVYTIDRGTADPGLRKVPVERLREIAQICQSATGVPSVVFD